MSAPYGPMRAIDILDLYFIENRSRIMDIASFLDRIDRYEGADEAKAERDRVLLLPDKRLAHLIALETEGPGAITEGSR